MATIVPAPVGTQNIGQGFLQFGQGLGQFLGARAGRRQGTQDITSLLQFIQAQQAQQQQVGQFDAARQAMLNLPPEQRAGLQLPQLPPVTPPFQPQTRMGGQLAAQLGISQALARTKPITPTKGTFQQIADPATGKQINALVDPTTGNIIRKFGTIEEGLSAKDKTTIAITQAKEFRADPRIKNLGIIERSERGMTAALKLATSPNVKSRIASDQTLGVLFQKMLDPESVVRESEFARTPEGAAAVNRLLAIAPQLRLGGLRLLDEDRQALVTMAQKLLTEAKISANRAIGEFTIRADEIGLNKRIVFGGVKPFDIIEEPSPFMGGLTPAERTRLAELERMEKQ